MQSQGSDVDLDVWIDTAGYGYLRPHVRLFDPGWRGPLVTRSTNGLLAEYGNDPVGLITRFAFQLAVPPHQTCSCMSTLTHKSLPSSQPVSIHTIATCCVMSGRSGGDLSCAVAFKLRGRLLPAKLHATCGFAFIIRSGRYRRTKTGKLSSCRNCIFQHDF